MSTIDGWLTEGTAKRTPVQRTPVIHLLIAETEEMWCSSSPGRPDNPFGNRLCRKCRELAREAVAEGMLDAKSAGRWSEGEEST